MWMRLSNLGVFYFKSWKPYKQEILKHQLDGKIY